ncbi:Uncharacterised protein r2_g772 [Pycnogonum litorale]
MEVIVSNKGGRKVCYQGHMYTLHAERQNGIWWKCVNRSSARCSGSLKTDLLCTNVIDGASTPHSHDPQPVQIRTSKVRHTMKERAKVTAEAPGQIFANVVAGIRDDELRAELPVEEHVKRSLRRQRRTLPCPNTLTDLGEIPEQFSTIGEPGAEQPFLIHDNGAHNPRRMLIFASEAGLRNLADAGKWFMDGTFSIAPDVFSQVYIIRVPLGTTSVTTVFALLPRKDRRTYEEFLQAVVLECEGRDLPINVAAIMTDFEDAMMRAVHGVARKG